MQKAHLYEAISLLNHGVDEAVRGLERLKKAPGVAEGIYRATVATLENARARVNLRFLAGMEQAEKRDARAMSRERTASDKPSWWSVHQILLALGERIRNERKQKGFSQEDFAAECGLHRTEMGLLERGKTIPRLDTLLLVSQYLGLCVSDLLRGIEL